LPCSAQDRFCRRSSDGFGVSPSKDSGRYGHKRRDIVIVGYAKRERSYAGFAVGIVLFFLVGLFIGLNCAENPVCDILDAHADGMAYGLYAAENGQDRMLALAAVRNGRKCPRSSGKIAPLQTPCTAGLKEGANRFISPSCLKCWTCLSRRSRLWRSALRRNQGRFSCTSR